MPTKLCDNEYYFGSIHLYTYFKNASIYAHSDSVIRKSVTKEP
jgi:hypothetical protein